MHACPASLSSAWCCKAPRDPAVFLGWAKVTETRLLPGMQLLRSNSAGELTFRQGPRFSHWMRTNLSPSFSARSPVPSGPRCDDSYSHSGLIRLTLMCSLSQRSLVYVNRGFWRECLISTALMVFIFCTDNTFTWLNI